MKDQFIALFVMMSILLIAGCAQNPYGTAYGSGDTRKMQRVQPGVIVKLNAVTIDGKGNVIGTIAGGALGGILGSSVGAGKGSDLAAVAGGLLGGVLGSKAGEEVSKRQGVNIVVRLNSGGTVAIVQEVNPKVTFHVGDKVDVYSEGQTSRVVKAN